MLTLTRADIDDEPTAEALAAARALITAEQATTPSTTSSSFLPAATPSSFTPTFETELERIASQAPLQPLDLSRYEAQEQPESTKTDGGVDTASLRAPLERAYVSSSYLASRNQNLQLLDRAGKNAWLLSNYHIEADLKTLEAELAATKREIDLVNAARATRQNDVKAEMQGLEENWKAKVGKVLETEIAVEELRQQVRDELRNQNQPQA